MKTYDVNYYLFPFEKIQKGTDIILYGFGKIGRQYCQQILESQYCNIVGIVDQNCAKESNIPIPVITPDELELRDNVTVVIAILNANDAREAIDILQKKGFSQSVIVHTNHSIPLKVTSKNGLNATNVESLSKDDAIKIYGEHFFYAWKKINHALRIYTYNGIIFERVGKDNDGGYVMCAMNPHQDERVAYSFGISNDVSWDDDMASRGWNVYMYDHTIDALPFEREEFHYFKQGISDSADNSQELKTLRYLIEQNRHLQKKRMVLKMDVEGAEYGFLLNTDEDILEKFDQIVMECHNLHSKDLENVIVPALEKLSNIFGVVHVHANNYADIIYVDGVPYPDVIEITLLNRSVYDLKESKNVVLPIEIDMPCRPFDDDIILGDWNDRGTE